MECFKCKTSTTTRTAIAINKANSLLYVFEIVRGSHCAAVSQPVTLTRTRVKKKRTNGDFFYVLRKFNSNRKKKHIKSNY